MDAAEDKEKLNDLWALIKSQLQIPVKETVQEKAPATSGADTGTGATDTGTGAADTGTGATDTAIEAGADGGATTDGGAGAAGADGTNTGTTDGGTGKNYLCRKGYMNCIKLYELIV